MAGCLFRLGFRGRVFCAGLRGGGACGLEGLSGGVEAVPEGECFALDAFDEGKLGAARGGVLLVTLGLLFSGLGLLTGGSEGIERFPPSLVDLQLGQLGRRCGEVGTEGGGTVFEGFALICGEGRVALDEESLLRDGLFACSMRFEDGFADFLESNGPCERLEDACAFGVIGMEESGELSLCEEHCASELIKGQADALFDGGLCFGDFA